MPFEVLTNDRVTQNDNNFSGGLNTGAPLSLQNNEASDIRNVDFNEFGDIQQRNGYSTLNGSAITNTPDIDGLHWFEYDSAGTLTRKAVAVAGAKFWKMDDLDGTWDDITGGLTITSGFHCDFENWNNKVFVTNGSDVPFEWDGSTAQTIQNLPIGLTDAKYVAQFNNYLFLANVIVSGTTHGSRIYWSAIGDEGSWSNTDFINVSNDDGQEITGIKVLSDRLVIYKTRSIYNLFFTGDSDIPFVLPGGGKSNSSVGCVSPFSIQEVNNGHVFLSYDGFYFYDGNNSYKISDRINKITTGLNTNRFFNAVSCVQKDENRYWCSVSDSGSNENDIVLVWDYFNNAWSIYDGISASSLSIFYVNGNEERPYFGDYGGFVYRADDSSQVDDNPAGVTTAISSYYYTNWRHYGDLVNQKGTDQIVVYYEHSNSVLTVGYSFEFEGKTLDDDNLSDQYTVSLDLSTSASVYGTAVYDGTDTYAATTGGIKRIDLTSRGRIIRLRFSNSTAGETWKVQGLGSLADLETNV